MIRRAWHPAEVAQVRAQYPHMQTKIIAAMLDRPLTAVYQRAQVLGLSKPPEYLASPAAGRTNGRQGMSSRFVKGQVSWNKGMHYTPGGRCASGWFKKGVRQGVAVRLYKPIGTLRVTKDGYLSRKVNDGMPLQRRWKLEHVRLWEEANGPVPKGYAVKILNGQKQDVRLENLALISRADLMRANTVHNLPKPLAEVVQLRGALVRQINRREGKHGRGKQDRGPARGAVRNAGGPAGQGQADGH